MVLPPKPHDTKTRQNSACRPFTTGVADPLSGVNSHVVSEALVSERSEERVETDLRLKLDGGEGLARNVSASGIYFVTDVAFKEGQRVKFSLEFMNFPGGPIEVKCTARIVRVEEQGASHGVGASISSFEFRRLPG